MRFAALLVVSFGFFCVCSLANGQVGGFNTRGLSSSAPVDLMATNELTVHGVYTFETNAVIVFQVINDHECILDSGGRHTYLKDYNGPKLRDGQGFRRRRLRVAGTKTYQTAIGSQKTVDCFEPVDEKTEAAIKQFESDKAKIFEACKPRRWKSSKNEVLYRKGTLVKLTGDKDRKRLTIKSKEGSKEYPASKLSAKDLKYVAKFEKKIEALKAELAKLPK